MYSVSVLRSIFDVRGSGEAIPSEPPSLARCGERRWRRGVAGIPLVDLSAPLSGMGGDPRLISVTAREDGPGNTRTESPPSEHQRTIDIAEARARANTWVCSPRR